MIYKEWELHFKKESSEKLPIHLPTLPPPLPLLTQFNHTIKASKPCSASIVASPIFYRNLLRSLIWSPITIFFSSLVSTSSSHISKKKKFRLQRLLNFQIHREDWWKSASIFPRHNVLLLLQLQFWKKNSAKKKKKWWTNFTRLFRPVKSTFKAFWLFFLLWKWRRL